MALPIAVFISGSGSNLQSIINAIESGTLDASITLVISNDPKAYGLERAEKHGLKTMVLDHREFSSRESFDLALGDLVEASGAEIIALAGFMRILTPGFLHRFENRVMNIHPALLPSFPGVHGQKQAADYGVRISGCTVHFVDDQVDHGPIIIQAAVPAFETDDEDILGARILALEHRIFPQALQWMAEKRLNIKGRKVRLKQKDVDPADDVAAQVALVNPPLEKGF